MSNPVVTTAGYEPATSAPILLRRSALNYVVIRIVPSLSLTVSEADRVKFFLISGMKGASRWSSRHDLNVRPPRPKRGVLPAELLLDNKREPTPVGLEPTLFNLRCYPIQ